MDLKSPTPKRKSNHTKSLSVPLILDSHNDYFDEYNNYCGYFNGFAVIIDDPNDMKAIYSMGFFGQASLSKGYPNFDKPKKNEPLILKETQWKRRKEWANQLQNLIKNLEINKNLVEPMDVVDDDDNDNNKTIESNTDINLPINTEEVSEITKTNKIKQNKVLVINDCKDVDDLKNLKPHLEPEPMKTVMEVLYLSLEEAFFLSFGLGCLQIFDLINNNKPMTILEIWRAFNCCQQDFIENYVAYHYFRAKNWVVRSGLKYGGQYLLYKDGPTFYHASYVVLIENCGEIWHGNVNNKEGQMTWNKMNSMNRMAEACNKEVLICKIKWPKLENNEDKNNPLILKKFKVNEYLLRRWQPCQEKEID